MILQHAISIFSVSDCLHLPGTNNKFSSVIMYYNKCKLPSFTCYFHSLLIRILMTHFTGNFFLHLLFKIAQVSCIFACSYSLPHSFPLTMVTPLGGSNGGEYGTTPAPFKSQIIIFNDTALGSNLMQPKGD